MNDEVIEDFKILASCPECDKFEWKVIKLEELHFLICNECKYNFILEDPN